MIDITSYTHYLSDQGKSEKTITNYVQDIYSFATWFEQANGQPLTPTVLTSVDVRDYKEWMQTCKRNKPATINRHLAAIKSWVGWALDSSQIDYSPIEKIRGIKEQPLAPKWLDKKVQNALYRVLEQAIQSAKTKTAKYLAVRDWAIITVMINTGVRVSELCSIQMDNITIYPRHGELRVIGKGCKARVIPLNQSARNAITQWLAIREQTPTLFDVRTRAVQAFISNLGDRIHTHVSPHILRHTFAKNLIQVGVSLEKVAAMMGHDSLDTTRIYTIPSAEDLQRAVNVLD